MRPTVVSATDLRTKTRDILEKARFEGEHFLVESSGKPMVAIVGIKEYAALVSAARNGTTGQLLKHAQDQEMEKPIVAPDSRGRSSSGDEG